MQTATHDAILIGGGLVGPTAALALAQAGLSVAVVDPLPIATRAASDFDGRGYAIALGSMRLLGALGLWDGLADKAEEISAIRVEDAAHDTPGPGLVFDPAELDESRFGWILEDRWLRAALLDAMAATGIDHRAATAATGFDFSEPLATVTLDDGSRLKAPLVIGADGRQSATARAAGITRTGWGYDQTGLVGAIEHELPHEGVAVQRFFPGGPFAVLPLPGNRSALVWSERTSEAKRLAALSDDAYTAELAARIGPRLGEIRLVGPRRSHPLGLSLADAYVAKRVALIGDAAHGVHPIAGQGLNLGLRDVAALVEVIVEARRRGEDHGALPVLTRYQQWRRFDAASFALGMDAINRLFSTANGPLGLLRGLGLGVVRSLPALRRSVMREAAGLAGDRPRLLDGQAP